MTNELIGAAMKGMRILVLMMLANSGVWAQSVTSTTGNNLLEHCQSKQGANVQSTVNSGACYGYINGVVDSIALYQDVLKAGRAVCIPEAPVKQIRDVVVQYLTNNPAHRHEDAAGLAYLALLKAFPCKR